MTWIKNLFKKRNKEMKSFNDFVRLMKKSDRYLICATIYTPNNDSADDLRHFVILNKFPDSEHTICLEEYKKLLTKDGEVSVSGTN